MNKSQKMKRSLRKARWENFKYKMKRIITWPWRMCCALWNWLKSIDIVGMINLTLLIVIIILFSSLILDFVRFNKCVNVNAGKQGESALVVNKADSIPENNRRVVKRKFNTALPLKADKKTNITPQIRTIGVAKPQVIKETSLAPSELPQQTWSGDVIVDVSPASPLISNGAKINGNLIIQNMRKYTLPCGMTISGHLFIRNVQKLYFCGDFTVNGNIYVNRQSSFGPLPSGAKINGQIVL